MDDVEYASVKQGVYDLTGLDLSAYKEKQMRRRIGAYIQRSGFPDWKGFSAHLRNQPDERRQLADYLMINVSEFFRDVDMWSRLENKIMPALLQSGRSLKVWSAGCSVGAELYSVAILLAESGTTVRYSLLGTDIDGEALSIAKKGGPYAAVHVAALPEARRNRFFRRDQDEVFVNPKLMARATFRKHNLLHDAHPTGFDLVMCRNVIIYFTAAAKNMVCQSLANALRPAGILILGGTEFLPRPTEYGLEHIGPSTYRRLER